MREGQRIAVDRVRELEGWDWFRLDKLVREGGLWDVVVAPSRRRYVIEVRADWDMEPWRSDLWFEVRVTADRGWRHWRPYRASGLRGGEDLPDVPPVTDQGRQPAAGRTGKALARARDDVAAGRLWKARDRLSGAVRREPTSQDALELLGEVHHAMGDLPQAGRYWILTERTGPDVDEALAAFEERWGRDVGEKLKMVPYREPAEDYPPPARERIAALAEQAQAAGITWPPSDGDDRSSEVDGASGWLSCLIFAVVGPGIWVLGLAAAIYLIVRWIG